MAKPVGSPFGQMVSDIKFRHGIAFTICTNEFHLPKNGREGVKLLSEITLEKWNTNFRLEYSVRKSRTTVLDNPLLPSIFRWNDPKSRVAFTFDFPRTFCRRLAETLTQLYQPVKIENKTNDDLLTLFSRALYRLHVLALKSDWFIWFSVSIWAGLSLYFSKCKL